MSKDNFSDFELNLNNNETDLTAEIAQQLKQMNGNNLQKFQIRVPKSLCDWLIQNQERHLVSINLKFYLGPI
jgi:hypothetical protein